MKVWKDRQGKWIDSKEFGQRFKQGVEGITPLQQTKSSVLGGWIILVGIIWGIVFASIYKQWWLVVILAGSLLVSGTSQLGAYQKLILLSKLEKELKGGVEQIV